MNLFPWTAFLSLSPTFTFFAILPLTFIAISGERRVRVTPSLACADISRLYGSSSSSLIGGVALSTSFTLTDDSDVGQDNAGFLCNTHLQFTLSVWIPIDFVLTLAVCCIIAEYVFLAVVSVAVFCFCKRTICSQLYPAYLFFLSAFGTNVRVWWMTTVTIDAFHIRAVTFVAILYTLGGILSRVDTCCYDGRKFDI